MKKDFTELVFILDKSGSMCGLEKDTIGGFNSMIEKQRKEEGEAVVTTVLFNDKVNVIHNRRDIKEVPLLTDKEYCVSGCTALLDALGNTVNHICKIHKNMNEEELPEKTLFIITTDGLENSSIEYTYSTLKRLIEKVKEKYKWEFIFLGANIDASQEARRFGIDESNAVNYNCDDEGIELNYECLSQAVSEIRRRKCLSPRWRDAIDEDIKKRKI